MNEGSSYEYQNITSKRNRYSYVGIAFVESEDTQRMDVILPSMPPWF